MSRTILSSQGFLCTFLFPILRLSHAESCFLRYLLYGDISAKAAHLLAQPQVMYHCFIADLDNCYFWTSNCLIVLAFFWFLKSKLCIYCSFSLQVSDFFAKLIQRVSPKSYFQAMGEVTITQKFLENFSGDQVPEDMYQQRNYVISSILILSWCYF